MSYPELTPEMANECSRATYTYSPDCYCVFHWGFADFLPRQQYHDRPSKWLEATVWRCLGPDQPDRYVVAVASDNGRELLRNLRAALSAITTGAQPDPSLMATDHARPQLSAALRYYMLEAG
jgi:hypothetical protein